MNECIFCKNKAVGSLWSYIPNVTYINERTGKATILKTKGMYKVCRRHMMPVVTDSLSIIVETYGEVN